MNFHFKPVGKPPPPLPRKPDLIISSITASGLFCANTLFNASYTGTAITLDSVTTSYLYEGNGNGGAFENQAGFIRLGKSSENGSLTLTFASNVQITKIVITCHDWYKSSEQYPTNTNLVAVNGSEATLAPYTADGTYGTLTFEFDGTNVVAISTSSSQSGKTGRIFIQSITVYGTVA